MSSSKRSDASECSVFPVAWTSATRLRHTYMHRYIHAQWLLTYTHEKSQTYIHTYITIRVLRHTYIDVLELKHTYICVCTPSRLPEMLLLTIQNFNKRRSRLIRPQVIFCFPTAASLKGVAFCTSSRHILSVPGAVSSTGVAFYDSQSIS